MSVKWEALFRSGRCFFRVNNAVKFDFKNQQGIRRNHLPPCPVRHKASFAGNYTTPRSPLLSSAVTLRSTRQSPPIHLKLGRFSTLIGAIEFRSIQQKYRDNTTRTTSSAVGLSPLPASITLYCKPLFQRDNALFLTIFQPGRRPQPQHSPLTVASSSVDTVSIMCC